MKEAPAHTGIRSGVPAIADDEPWPREVFDAVGDALADALVADFKGIFHPMVKSSSGTDHKCGNSAQAQKAVRKAAETV